MRRGGFLIGGGFLPKTLLIALRVRAVQIGNFIESAMKGKERKGRKKMKIKDKIKKNKEKG